jgi:hypothetical protein
MRGNTSLSLPVCLISFRSHPLRIDLDKYFDFILRRRLCFVLEENLTRYTQLIFIGRFLRSSSCTKHCVYVLFTN